MNLTSISTISMFIKFGFFALIFDTICTVCTTEIEKVKKDGNKIKIKKINYVLIFVYSLISFAIYTLFVWQIILMIIFIAGMLALFGIQNIRPDLLAFFDQFNKNKILKFVCKLLMSFSLFLGLFYKPIITSIQKKVVPVFFKLTNDFDSDLIQKVPDFRKLNKEQMSTIISDNFSSLENYLCSSIEDDEQEEQKVENNKQPQENNEQPQENNEQPQENNKQPQENNEQKQENNEQKNNE